MSGTLTYLTIDVFEQGRDLFMTKACKSNLALHFK